MLKFKYEELEEAVQETITLASRHREGEVRLFAEIDDWRQIKGYKISYIKSTPHIDFGAHYYFHIVTIKGFKDSFVKLLKEMEADESMSDTIMQDLIFNYNFETLVHQLQSDGCEIE
jgi:hypothetical protein